MPRNATPSRCHQHAWADPVYILPESASGARRPYEAPVAAFPGRRKRPPTFSWNQKVGGPFVSRIRVEKAVMRDIDGARFWQNKPIAIALVSSRRDQVPETLAR